MRDSEKDAAATAQREVDARGIFQHSRRLAGTPLPSVIFSLSGTLPTDDHRERDRSHVRYAFLQPAISLTLAKLRLIDAPVQASHNPRLH